MGFIMFFIINLIDNSKFPFREAILSFGIGSLRKSTLRLLVKKKYILAYSVLKKVEKK